MLWLSSMMKCNLRIMKKCKPISSEVSFGHGVYHSLGTQVRLSPYRLFHLPHLKNVWIKLPFQGSVSCLCPHSPELWQSTRGICQPTSLMGEECSIVLKTRDDVFFSNLWIFRETDELQRKMCLWSIQALLKSSMVLQTIEVRSFCQPREKRKHELKH